MSSVNLNLSKQQLSRLRNGHSIQLRANQIGQGNNNIMINSSNMKKLSKAYKTGKGVRIQLDKDEIIGSGLKSNIKSLGKTALKNKQIRKLADKGLEKGMNYASDYAIKQGADENAVKFIKKQATKGINKEVDTFVEGGNLLSEYQNYKQGSGIFSKRNMRKGLKTGLKGLKQANKISNALGYDDIDDMLIEGVVNNTVGKIDPTGLASKAITKELQKQSDKQIERHGGSFQKIGGALPNDGYLIRNGDNGRFISTRKYFLYTNETLK